MPTLSFIHAADLHLDSPFVGLQQVNEQIAQRLRDATFEAFDNLVQAALDHEVDFILVAGDVYDSAEGGLRAQAHFRKGLTKLALRGIPSYVVHGNHDPLDRWISAIDWPDEVKVFSKEDNQSHTFYKGDEPVARIHGISYPTKRVSETFGRKFQRTGPEPFQIGLFHCNVNGDPRHDDYAPRTLDELRECNLDYWALGHVHERKVLNDNSPFVAYPGNIQGRHIRETGPRGAMLIRTRGATVEHHEFLPLHTVRWEHNHVDIGGLTTVDGLIEQIQNGVESDGRSLIVRITLTGRGPLHTQLARDLQGVLGMVRESCASTAGNQFVWIERVEDRTRPEVDLVERANEEDFVGSLLRIAGSLQTEDITAALNGLWLNNRASGHLQSLEEHELAAILDQAVAMVAEPLLEDE